MVVLPLLSYLLTVFSSRLPNVLSHSLNLSPAQSCQSEPHYTVLAYHTQLTYFSATANPQESIWTLKAQLSSIIRSTSSPVWPLKFYTVKILFLVVPWASLALLFPCFGPQCFLAYYFTHLQKNKSKAFSFSLENSRVCEACLHSRQLRSVSPAFITTFVLAGESVSPKSTGRIC